jgi:hypothetical protein
MAKLEQPANYGWLVTQFYLKYQIRDKFIEVYK